MKNWLVGTFIFKKVVFQKWIFAEGRTPPHFSAFIFEKIYIFYQKVISFLKKMSCLTESTRFFIFGVVFQKWIFAEGRTPRTLVLVSITTHLTVRQITTHLTVRRVRTHIVSIFLLKYSHFDRKSPKNNYYIIPYKNPLFRKGLKTHFSEMGPGRLDT